MKFPVRKDLSFEKKVKIIPGEYFSEIIEAKTPDGYAEDSAVQLTYALRTEPDGEVVAKKSEIMPFTSDRWYDFQDKLLEAGLNIDDTDDLIGIREKQVYKKVAGRNGYCYTNITYRELILGDET